jgi:hypothetical protein
VLATVVPPTIGIAVVSEAFAMPLTLTGCRLPNFADLNVVSVREKA